MEVVGAASSVIAVIQITGSIIDICGGYIGTARNAINDINDLQKSVKDCRAVLQRLSDAAHGPNSQKLLATRELIPSISDCFYDLKALETKLTSGGNGTADQANRIKRFAFRTIRWPLTKRDVDRAISNLERHKRLFLLALQVDQTALTEHMDRKSDLTKLPMADGAAFDSYSDRHEEECLPHTRTEILHQIACWSKDPHGNCIFWLNGMAGTGKSTIARTMARNLKQNGSLAASFFFKRGEGDRSNASRFFPTIVRQLVLQIPQLDVHVAQVVDSDPSIATKSLKEQFYQLLLHPLCHLGPGDNLSVRTMVIVIDALDECEQEADIRTILRLLPCVKECRTIQLRFLVTSRPELPIRLGFKHMSGGYQDLILHDIPEETTRHDICLFLRHRFAQIRQVHSLPQNWPREEDIQNLTEMAVPLFIFAATVCRFVGDLNWEPEERLATVLQNQIDSSMSKLDRTYTPILTQLLTGQDQEESEVLIREVQDIIGVIIILASPLSIISLSTLLEIPVKKINRRLEAFHSVLSIPTEAHGSVRLLHLSFRDFLLDPRTDSRFRVDGIDKHGRLAIQCVRIMSYGLKKNICNLPDYGSLRVDVGKKAVNDHLSMELKYACRYWVHHMLEGKLEIRDGDNVHVFLREHLLHWLEAMAMLEIMAESANCIAILQSLVQPRTTCKLSTFLYDARRFILKYAGVIDAAPLQLYCSALVFAPENSVTRNTFKDQIPSWIRRQPRVETSWSSNLQTLEGHSSSVPAIAFSPDGKLVASGSRDHTVKLWDVTSGILQQTLDGHSDWVGDVAFSPDGQLVASCSGDCTIILWNPTTGSMQQRIEAHSSWVSAVQFSPNGSLFASCSHDYTIKLWNTLSRTLLWTIEAHPRWVSAIAFSPDGQLIASCSRDHKVKIWDTLSGTHERTLEGHLGWVGDVTFSPDGKLLASVSWDRTIRVWDVISGTLRQTLEGHSDWVSAVKFSPDGKLIVSCSHDGTIKLWERTSGRLQQTLESHARAVETIAYHPDGSLLASGSKDHTIKFWDTTPESHERILEGHSDQVSAIALSPDNTLAASGSYDATVKLWDTVSGTLRHSLEGHLGAVEDVTFSSDGRLVASCSDDGTVKLWDTMSMIVYHTLHGHLDWVITAAFSPDNMLLASGSHDTTVKLWDIASGTLQHTLEGHSNAIEAISFSPDGNTIASICDSHIVKLWNTASGTLRRNVVVDGTLSRKFCGCASSFLLGSGSDALNICLDHNNASKTPLVPQNISVEGSWVVWGGTRTLWLPPEYRPTCWVVGKDTLILGHASGSISFMEFATESLDRSSLS